MNFRIVIFLFFFGGQSVFAQLTDTLQPVKQPRKLAYAKSAIAPVFLFGLGLSTMKNNGVYSSYDARDDVQEIFPNFRTKADNYVFFIPIVGLYAFDAFSSQNRHEVGRQTTLLLSSAALMGAIIYPLKTLTGVIRPNGRPHAFPSGHTSSAFVVAAVTAREFRDKSPWIGIGSYTVASATGVLRILNNKHWLSDVLAGAGVGLISAHTVYYLHDHLLKRKNNKIGLMPLFQNGSPGLTFMATF